MTSAHVNYDGSGFTVQYTVNGGVSWSPLSEDGVVALDHSSDFDLKFTFTGGVVNDTSALNGFTVYILKTETTRSTRGRVLTFSQDPITPSGMVINGPISIAAADTSAALEPQDPTTVTGPTDYNIGTIEAWVNNSSTANPFSGVSGTLYVNGVASSTIPTTGAPVHCVLVLSSRTNSAFTIGSNLTISHLAVYSNQLTAGGVLNLYIASSGTPVISINDDGGLSVTEPSPPVDIYAYNWSVITGGQQ
jgi:hypothetical protein